MKKHYGEIVESVVRRKGYSITTLANDLMVNRRSVYNWFESTSLKPAVICQIGLALRHDFSQEFPHLFTSDDFKEIYKPKSFIVNTASSDIWQTKYIALLEKYNDLLNKAVYQNK